MKLKYMSWCCFCFSTSTHLAWTFYKIKWSCCFEFGLSAIEFFTRFLAVCVSMIEICYLEWCLLLTNTVPPLLSLSSFSQLLNIAVVIVFLRMYIYNTICYLLLGGTFGLHLVFFVSDGNLWCVDVRGEKCLYGKSWWWFGSDGGFQESRWWDHFEGW